MGYYISLTRDDGEVRDDGGANSLEEARKVAQKLCEQMCVNDRVVIFPDEFGDDDDDTEEAV